MHSSFLILLTLQFFVRYFLPIFSDLLFSLFYFIFKSRGPLLSVVANFLNSDIIVSTFELQLSYGVHFDTNTIGNGSNPLIPTAMVEIVPLLFFCKNEVGIKYPTNLFSIVSNLLFFVPSHFVSYLDSYSYFNFYHFLSGTSSCNTFLPPLHSVFFLWTPFFIFLFILLRLFMPSFNPFPFLIHFFSLTLTIILFSFFLSFLT